MNTIIIVIDSMAKIIFLLILLFSILTMSGISGGSTNLRPPGDKPEHPNRPKKKKDSNKE